MAKIELNEKFKEALALLENTPKNVFITGKAGTGKSTFLEHFRSVTKKNIVVLAPTGVAALNVRGETIHSFFRFKPDITIGKVKKLRGRKADIFRELDAVVIDEVSMVRADLLDCIDRFLRINGKKRKVPFGGIQMVFIGDLYQLPPVVTGKEKGIFKNHYDTPYFFSAKVFEEFSMEFIELEKVYRQKDEKFIHLLNAIRNNSLADDDLELLNRRVNADFARKEAGAYIVHLTSTNRVAAEINAAHLRKLKGPVCTYTAQINGDFAERAYPADYKFSLASGAQVMFLNNDAKGRWVNGTLGEIVQIRKGGSKEEPDTVLVRLADGKVEKVLPFTWEIFHFTWNDFTQSIETETAGSFTQYPLRLAWAVTIHKSQGKTFDKIVIDISGGVFACGQIYVALSRCRSLGGIVLKKPLKREHIFVDWRIVDFVTKYQYKISEDNISLEEKIKFIQEAAKAKIPLKITYLKANDEKTRRIIQPLNAGKMMYAGKSFIGMEAYCRLRKDKRVFRVDRILEIENV